MDSNLHKAVTADFHPFDHFEITPQEGEHGLLHTTSLARSATLLGQECLAS